VSAAADTVFLLDVDNTLLDNDRIYEDLGKHLEREFNKPGRDRYWAIFEALRAELGYADYLGTLQRYRSESTNGGMTDSRLLLMSSFLVDYPFADRLYSDVIDTIAHLARSGTTVILSDGDAVFQPRKIQRSGLWEAVGGRLTTVFPRQGHYALDPYNLSAYPPADHAVDRIGELLRWGSST
jgi:FMN phosphatase YigB (HAD superfamily)